MKNPNKMSTSEATIKITKENSKPKFISISIPVWLKSQDVNNILIKIPLLGINTLAFDENDAEVAISESIALFCIASEEAGKGIEAELESLGWKINTISDNETIAEFEVDEIDDLLERILETGENYLNEHLELQYA